LACLLCGGAFVVNDGIPVLLPPRSAAAHATQWQRQREYFDREVHAEFEIERPEAGGRFYGYVLRTKFKRALKSPPLQDSYERILDACCGSGLLAEELAGRARTVLVGFDFSLGAIRRACERARRRGYKFLGVVGDASTPPFAPGSFDLVAVHDALHHLEEPLEALPKLAELSGDAVVIMEPGRSWLTRLAVQIGFSTDLEDAGNSVHRFTGAQLQGVLRQAGFRTAKSRRYVMYYPHEPGELFRLLDRSPLYQIGRLMLSLGFIAGPVCGNKIQVFARR
jgi:SAM-dependent methyltransferase